ncbi:hypothetical protein V8E53_007573 [Lactarius tabidus]
MEGAFVRALGTIFHLQCFTCIDCGDVVATKFFPIDDPNGNEKQHPLCERDYFRRLDLICTNCCEALRGSYITACEKKFHVEHFVCTLCPTLFGPHDSYYEHNKDPYCHYHYSTRFATKCVGCKTAILKQFVEINRNQRDECWHPECYMIDKFWNVQVVPHGPRSTDTTEPPYVEEERQESRMSLKEKQIKMEQQVYRIWTVLSAFEESSAGTVSGMLRHVSDGLYLEAIRMAEGTVLHVEVLFATIDDLEWRFASLDAKGMSHVRESRMLCRKLVDLFTLLSLAGETGTRRMGMTQELLALITGIAHYLKILIRITLTGALKLKREHDIDEALGSFLDKIHLLAVQKGRPSAHRMMAGAKDVAPTSQPFVSINRNTYGVAYGFRSLAPEVAGASPFFDASQDFAISNVPVPSPPSDLCVACAVTVEEDCVRLGTYQRWHLNCIRCALCGINATPAASGNAEDKSLVKLGSGTGDGTVAAVNSTAWRPLANMDVFVWRPDSVMSTFSFGKVPTAIYCTDHALRGCLGGFQAVSRLEQYAFLLNVALRRLHLLLKKRNVIPPTPSNTVSHSSGGTDSNPSPQELMRFKSVHLDQKLSATSLIPNRSTIVESPAGQVAHFNDASSSKGDPPRSLPPRPTSANIPRLEEAENVVEQGRSLPGHSIVIENARGKVAYSRDASTSTDGALENLLPAPTPSSFPRLEEPGKAPKQRRPLPPLPTDEGIALADIPQLPDVAQSMEQDHSTPPQNLMSYVAELTPLELAIVRHAAVAVLCRSSLRNEMDLDQILEMLEVKRQRFWERVFKPGNDRKKKVRLAGLFGVPLELLVERDGSDSLFGASRAPVRVPYFIGDVISSTRQMDMKVDFRKAGSIRRRKELITALERDPNSVDFSRERPEDIASLLKHFLCELPDPLMTFKLQGLFIAVTSLPDDKERKRLLHMLTLILPKCHRDTLEVLLVFLKRVSSSATARDDTATDSYLSNLAGVIGPSVLFSGNWVQMSRSTGGGVLKKYDAGTRVMTELLENQDQFFTVPEEFSPLLHDQEFFAGSMELSSKDFLKQCETYMRIKFGGPAAGNVRILGKKAERVRRQD